jgi:tol-pal system protein YbgF
MNNLQALGRLALVTLLLGGCAANDVMVKRQTETETKVEHLFQVLGGLEGRLNELSGRQTALEEKDSQQTKLFQELSDKINTLSEANRSLQVRLQGIPAVVVTPKVEVVNPDPPSKSKDTGPPQAYLKAFGLYSTNNFTAAVHAFEQFLKEQPSSDYVPNATYWIGECYYSSSDLPKALVAFQKVLDSWPRHPKASDALLKIGYSYSALKQHDKAKAAFEGLIRSYPGSPAAVKARERLMSSSQPVSVQQ